MTSLHPEAAATAFQALAAVVRDPKLSPAAFPAALEAALIFADRHTKAWPSLQLPGSPLLLDPGDLGSPALQVYV